MKVSSHTTVTDMHSWCKIRQVDGWIEACPCRMKNSTETKRSSTKFLKLSEKPEVIYTENSLQFGKLVMNYIGNTTRLHLIVLRQIALLIEQYG